MSQISILAQNVGGNGLGRGRVVGRLCPLKLTVHARKPTFVILTETRHGNDATGKNVFSGFKLMQYTETEQRAAGVMVYCKKGGITMEQNSEIKSNQGNYTMAVYNKEGQLFILAAVYGPPQNSDRESTQVYEEMNANIVRLKYTYNTSTVIIGGDFNLHLDKNNVKPRACRYVEGMIQEHGLKDLGVKNKENTWRRPNNRNKSRIDYILVPNKGRQGTLETIWSRLDHAAIIGTAEIGPPVYIKERMHDWVLTQKEFVERGERIISDTLIDHSQHKNKSADERKDFYEKRISEYEANLEIVDRDCGIFYTHVFIVILKRLMVLQKRIYKEKKEARNKKARQIQNEIGELYSELDRQGDRDDNQRQGIIDRIEEKKQELTEEAENWERAKNIRIENFYRDNNGKNTSASFQIVQEPKSSKHISMLHTGEGNITNKEDICKALENSYKDQVGEDFLQTCTLEEYIRKYEIEIGSIKDDQKEALEEEIASDEIRLALKKAKAQSAPGPTGQTVAIFKYLNSEIPYIFSKVVNEIAFVPRFQQIKLLDWIKERFIVFIPKVGKAPNKIENLRPLSLLETFYKIITRILTNRLGNTLDQVVSKHQHGFMPGRSIQTCSLQVMEAIQDAERRGTPLQIISVDIQGAFNAISPEVIRQVMQKEGYPEIFSEALHNLTGNGIAKVYANGQVGKSFDTKTGTGQGDPPSAGRFNIGADPSLRALERYTEQQDIRYKLENGQEVPPTGYADDIIACIQARNVQQVKGLIQVFHDYTKVSGLKINIKKSEVMCINTPEDLEDNIKEQVGLKVVEGMKHLGIQLRKSIQQVYDSTIEEISNRAAGKANRIHSSHADMWHKKQLIMHAYIPAYYHLFNVIGIRDTTAEELDKKIGNLLWTKKENGIEKKKRRLVASTRMAASYQNGGLQIARFKDIIIGLACNFMQRMLKEKDKEDKLFIYERLENLLLTTGMLNLQEMFNWAGSKTWEEAGDRIKRYSNYLGFACKAMGHLMEKNERSKENMSAAIMGNALGKDRLSTADGLVLAHHGIYMVAHLFQEDFLTGTLDMSRDADFPQELQRREPEIVAKCKRLRGKIGRAGGRQKRPQSSFSLALQQVKGSRLYRKMARDEIDGKLPGPPSYFTRRKDGYSVPVLHKYMQGYVNLIKGQLATKTLEVNFNIMNRVAWTNQKQYKSGVYGGGTGNCSLCGAAESTQHLIFDCEEYAEIFWDMLSKAITKVEGKRVSVHMYNVMYNTHIEGVGNTGRKAYFHAIQEGKRHIIKKRYQRCANPNLDNIIYDGNRVISHWTNILNGIISFQKYKGKNEQGYEVLLESLQELYED